MRIAVLILGIPLVSTVGGLVTHYLGHIPVEGEKLVWAGYELEVIDMDGVRIDKVLARPVEPGQGG